MQNFLLALRPLPIARLAFGIFDLTRPVHWGQLLSQASLAWRRWRQRLMHCWLRWKMSVDINFVRRESAQLKALGAEPSALHFPVRADVEAWVTWEFASRLRPRILAKKHPPSKCTPVRTVYAPPQVPQMRQVGAGRGPSSLPAS